MEEEAKQRLDYLYKEYVRLSDKAEEFIKSTIDDFKLFGVVGAFIVLWKPIAELILSTNSKLDAALVLFLGFLSLLLVLGIVGLLNLFKQSYAWYFIHNLKAYGKELKKAFHEAEDSQIFNFNLGKDEPKFVASYRLTFKAFLFCFGFAIIVMPSIILGYSNVLYAVLYCLTSLISFLVVYVQLLKKMIKQYSNSNYL
ncbi:MAG: hypothetical protein RBJ76_09985 [Stenomitos frigidus ULC029]